MDDFRSGSEAAQVASSVTYSGVERKADLPWTSKQEEFRFQFDKLQKLQLKVAFQPQAANDYHESLQNAHKSDASQCSCRCDICAISQLARSR